MAGRDAARCDRGRAAAAGRGARWRVGAGDSDTPLTGRHAPEGNMPSGAISKTEDARAMSSALPVDYPGGYPVGSPRPYPLGVAQAGASGVGLSIVVPVYNGAASVGALVDALAAL